MLSSPLPSLSLFLFSFSLSPPSAVVGRAPTAMLEVVPWRATARSSVSGAEGDESDASSLPYLMWAGSDGALVVWEILPTAAPRVALRCDASELLLRSPSMRREVVSVAPTRAGGVPVVVVQEISRAGSAAAAQDAGGARFTTFAFAPGAQCWFLAADSAQLRAGSGAPLQPLGTPSMLDRLQHDARAMADQRAASGAAGRSALELLDQSAFANRAQRLAAVEMRLAAAVVISDGAAYLRHVVAYTRLMCEGARSSRRDGKVCVRGTRSRELRDQLVEFCYSLVWRGSGDVSGSGSGSGGAANVAGMSRRTLLQQHVLPIVDDEASLRGVASEIRAAMRD